MSGSVTGATGASSTPTMLLPTGAIAATMDRRTPNNNSLNAITVTGTMLLTGIWLPKTAITSITFVSAGAATGPTHQWFGLYDSNLHKLAVTSDDLTTAWGGTTAKTLNITGAPYTPTYEGLHYLAYNVTVNTTMPSLVCATFASYLLSGTISPMLCGKSTASLTGVSTAPDIAATPTASSVGFMPYAWVS